MILILDNPVLPVILVGELFGDIYYVDDEDEDDEEVS